MFRLIGILVVAFVLYVGWDAFQGWYAGEATPQETVEKVRSRVGDAISSGNGSSAGKTDESVPPFKEEPIENVVPTKNQVAEPPPDLNSQTRNMLNDALK